MIDARFYTKSRVQEHSLETTPHLQGFYSVDVSVILASIFTEYCFYRDEC